MKKTTKAKLVVYCIQLPLVIILLPVLALVLGTLLVLSTFRDHAKEEMSYAEWVELYKKDPEKAGRWVSPV